MQKPDFNFPPIFKKLKRGGPAIVLPKDSGAIIAYAGISKESLVIEAGAGTGFLTVALASVAKEVISYEMKKEFADLASANVRAVGLTNVTIKNKDVTLGIDEKDVDVVMLDMQHADKAVKIAFDVLKKDGCVVGYLPNVEQAKEFYLECQKQFKKVFMIETIVREYEVRDFGVRPAHWGLTHSAFLVFGRK
ncbi:MAG: methyltransferase domain-containing protein [Candidatus Micrarchaeota archaeon]|nr:methyltransferase domain-containing protein [Candidatus Micrarchaeota archaeon]